MEYNKVYLGDSEYELTKMPDASVDFVITSPPYDNLRTYGSISEWTFDKFKGIASQLYRVIKNGGVVVWVVGDSTVDGSETGTSFRQALFFKDLGFNIHDTMIWNKGSFSFPSQNCYHQVFEYMFVFSKGVPKTMNFIKDRKNLFVGERGASGRKRDGSRNEGRSAVRDEYGKRFNIWDYPIGGGILQVTSSLLSIRQFSRNFLFGTISLLGRMKETLFSTHSWAVGQRRSLASNLTGITSGLR